MSAPNLPQFLGCRFFHESDISATELKSLLREDLEAEVTHSQLHCLHVIYSPSSQRVFNLMILQAWCSHTYLDMTRHSLP